MNVTFDLTPLLVGFALGIPASLLFFLGLGWGMQLALKSKHTGWLLLLSFLLRSALLVGVIWLMIQWLHPLWAIAGFMLAFVLVRRITTSRVKAQQQKLAAEIAVQPSPNEPASK